METKNTTWSDLKVLGGPHTAGGMARYVRDLVARGEFSLAANYLARLQANDELHRMTYAVEEGCLA